MAVRAGRLLKKGEPDIACVARMVLNDWQRGKLPFYIVPPGFEVPLSQQETDGEGKKEEKTTASAAKKNAEEISKEDDGKTDEEEYESDEKTDDKEESEDDEANLQVVQDFSQIRVGLTFDESADRELIKTNKVNKLEKSKSSDSLATTKYSDSDEDSDAEDYSSDDEEYDERPTKKAKNEPETKGGFVVTDVETNVKPKKKLTAKQRRAIERSQKPKKTGSHFYDYANVKNRNRNRKKPKNA